MVCAGNYRRLKLRLSGRRNSLGCIKGRRTEEYISGSTRAFAVCVGSNTPTAPNFCLPPTPATHDAACEHPDCREMLQEGSSAEKKRTLEAHVQSHTKSPQRARWLFHRIYFQRPTTWPENPRKRAKIFGLPGQLFGRDGRGQALPEDCGAMHGGLHSQHHDQTNDGRVHAEHVCPGTGRDRSRICSFL